MLTRLVQLFCLFALTLSASLLAHNGERHDHVHRHDAWYHTNYVYINNNNYYPNYYGGYPYYYYHPAYYYYDQYPTSNVNLNINASFD